MRPSSAIVNRRQSDLTDKADGILYTSDGRDVEMSVASTKAFYAQVAAGALLACAITEAIGCGSDQERHALLAGLRELPGALRTVLTLQPEIADAARRLAPSRRYWAVVGNGPNSVAAEEIRIKLSELCYKSIACDVTEDKKHIDLSSEPLILVCAAGLIGSTADDVAKEVAIFRAHKAAPVVIATEGEERFRAAPAVITVPWVQPELAFVLAAMVGHLFGYEAALAIDALARPLREAREVIERAVGTGAPEADELLGGLREDLAPLSQRFLDGLRSGAYDGNLEASTAVGLVGRLRDITSDAPLESYQRESGRVATPAGLVDDLTAALSRGIDELTRPVDAIKHQAKTVTVGISRSDEALLDRPLVQAVLAAGAPRERLSYTHAAVARRARPGGRRGGRLHPLRGRGRPRLGRGHDRDRRPGRGLARRAVAGRAQPAPAGHEAPGRHGARAARRPGPSRRPDRADGARGQGLAVHGHHPRARAVRRAAAGAGGARRAAGLGPPLRPPGRLGHGDRGRVPGRPAGRDPGGRPPDDPRERPGRALAVSFRARPPGASGLRRRR